MFVKPKTKVKIGMKYEIQLQGLVYFGVVEEAKAMELSVGDWVKRVVELELLRQGRLPDWWYTRKKGVM